MRRCDVLIVGGGPAGSSCARGLAERGFEVVVLDEARFPRHKTCAGWITPPVLDLLGIDRAEYAKGRVLQPITGFRVSCARRREVRVRFGRVVSYGIRRCEFDDYLLHRCGAEVREETRVTAIERNGRDWVVNGCYSAPVVVGAGGHFCPVARMLGARVSAERAVVAREAEWRRAALEDPEEPALLFFPDRRGYGWRLQKGEFANIGFGRLGPGPLTAYEQSFTEWMSARGPLPLELPAWHGHAYLTAGSSRRRACDDGVLLVGDAAGLADPHSGEGIRPAVESGLMAASCVARARGDTSRAGLARYAQLLGGRYASRLPEWPVPQFVARGLMSVPLFVREVVVQRWFLHLNDRPIELAH